MSNNSEKQVFHEFLAFQMATAPIGITSTFSDTKTADLLKVCHFAEACKMPAAKAHEIAQMNAGMPEILRGVGVHPDVIAVVEATLADLASREDEKKADKPAGGETSAQAGTKSEETVAS